MAACRPVWFQTPRFYSGTSRHIDFVFIFRNAFLASRRDHSESSWHNQRCSSTLQWSGNRKIYFIRFKTSFFNTMENVDANKTLSSSPTRNCIRSWYHAVPKAGQLADQVQLAKEGIHTFQFTTTCTRDTEKPYE